METRHPVEGYFEVSFGRSVIIAELWRPEVARPGNCVSNFCVFWKKLPTVKFSKLCSESFHRLTDRRCCVQILWNVADEKSVKSCVIYLTKTIFRLPLKLSLLRRSRPKSVRASPQQCAQVPQISSNRFTFGGVRIPYSRTREHRFCPVDYFLKIWWRLVQYILG